MMTDGDVSAPDRAGDLATGAGYSIAGQVAIMELLRAQVAVPWAAAIAGGGHPCRNIVSDGRRISPTATSVW